MFYWEKSIFFCPLFYIFGNPTNSLLGTPSTFFNGIIWEFFQMTEPESRASVVSEWWRHLAGKAPTFGSIQLLKTACLSLVPTAASPTVHKGTEGWSEKEKRWMKAGGWSRSGWEVAAPPLAAVAAAEQTVAATWWNTLELSTKRKRSGFSLIRCLCTVQQWLHRHCERENSWVMERKKCFCFHIVNFSAIKSSCHDDMTCVNSM